MIKNLSATDVRDLRDKRETDSVPGLGMATPVFLPGKSHGQRSLVGYRPWGHKESDMNEATQQAHIQN